MSVRPFFRPAFAALAAIMMLAGPMIAGSPAQAQEPSRNSLQLANEILEIKGQLNVFEPLIPGVVEQSKNTLLQMNPNLFKDLNDVAAALRKEYAPRMASLRADVAKIYASRFSEQELKDTLAFYKSPLGKKLLEEEPVFVERSMSAAQEWAVKLNEEALQRFRAEMKKRGHAM